VVRLFIYRQLSRNPSHHAADQPLQPRAGVI